MSLFTALKILPPDPILGLPVAFRADPRPNKVNLGVGAYRDDDGKPRVLDVVHQAEGYLLEGRPNKEYLPIDGDRQFVELTEQLLFGDALPKERFSAQTVGASGALCVGARLLTKVTGQRKIMLSNPTWPNHQQIFEAAGFTCATYPYYDTAAHRLDTEGMLAALRSLPKGTPLVLQACCHNPTGLDLTLEQWKEVAAIVQQQQLIPFFDIAYQGFGEGVEKDAAPVRLFAEMGIDMLIAYSYSKNLGLYGERTGMLTVVGQGKGVASQVKRIIRTLYSSPPKHGALIAKTVLGNPALKQAWIDELAAMRQRITTMREKLADMIPPLSFIKQQRGMFSFTDLPASKVRTLTKEFGIYLTEDGRISVAGLNGHNLGFVANAIKEVL